jgi:hypothetical protein
VRPFSDPLRAQLLLSAFLVALAGPASAQKPRLVSPDQARFRLNGFLEAQVRALSDGFRADRAYLSQSALVLNLEPELDIAPDGFGPFDLISAFARVEVRYDCVYQGCSSLGSSRTFGDSARSSPARNWADARTEGFVGGIDLGELGIERRRVQADDRRLLGIAANPRFDHFYAVGIDPETVAAAFGPTASDLFSWKAVPGPRESVAGPLGPWAYESEIQPNGALAGETSTTSALPLRPSTESLFTPSSALRGELGTFGSFDQNFTEGELAWNLGASQEDELFLREAYLDLELLDSRLWLRIGKQNIVWGKTELFRTTDQFNPVDIGLASLPSFEESRVPLWSLRAVYSLYDVGPLRDVRLEGALNFDDFEPIDTGRCGEPYTVWLICFKSTGLWAHGTFATGIAGEKRPPKPWHDAKGLEGGARVEFRWRRFSFALSEFYGYDDIPSLTLFNEYERLVDPASGRPLAADGAPLDEQNALALATGNRQAFDLGCKASLGFGEQALLALTGGFGTVPDLSERCIGDILNLVEPIELSLGGATLAVPPTNAIGALLSGQDAGRLLLGIALTAVGRDPGSARLVPLARDPNDGPPGGGVFGTAPIPGFEAFSDSNLSGYLTDEQEALLGCGPFYRTDCDADGIDLFHSEASVVLQAFPDFEENPVATRFANGEQVILPGARGPGDPDYDPGVDGTPPRMRFASEMEALSRNLGVSLAVLGIAEGDTACQLDDLATCAAVRAVVALSGSRRPELRAGGNGRYGRRDWGWHGGGEAYLSYPKRNVLGLSADFAEDRTKTNWGLEFTWIAGQTFASNTAPDLVQEADVFNLTISLDRPTFVNFLNPNRTFFLNTQIFFRYVPEHDASFDTNGPLTALATFTVASGYFQDRLQPVFTFVYDFDSGSGGVLSQLTYRYSEIFSITLGALGFWGQPQSNHIPFQPIALPDTDTRFEADTRYEGLSAIAERDEVFLRLRYTF